MLCCFVPDGVWSVHGRSALAVLADERAGIGRRVVTPALLFERPLAARRRAPEPLLVLDEGTVAPQTPPRQDLGVYLGSLGSPALLDSDQFARFTSAMRRGHGAFSPSCFDLQPWALRAAYTVSNGAIERVSTCWARRSRKTLQRVLGVDLLGVDSGVGCQFVDEPLKLSRVQHRPAAHMNQMQLAGANEAVEAAPANAAEHLLGSRNVDQQASVHAHAL